MSTFVLFLIILVEGFVTISTEILTIRQLLPVVGNSVVVTSLIIGVFLLFLAYGYRRGGKYPGLYTDILKRNFTLAAVWLGLGLSYAFIHVFFYYFQTYISQQILIALAAYLIIVTAPLVYILGQTVPITMNFILHEKSAGAVGGKILHLSTIGSFLGSIFTSVILMEYLGVAWTIMINFCLLLFLNLMLYKRTLGDKLSLIILGVMLFLCFDLNVSFEKKQFVATNPYGNYQVDNYRLDKQLIINDSGSSLLSYNQKGYPYIEKIKEILFKDLNLKNKDILVLGAGGFTLSAETTNENHFTYIDVDKDIEKIIKEHFLADIKGQFISEDARSFLNSTQNKFDVIISDAYSNQRSIPAHLLTQQYFKLIYDKLNNDGLAIFNIVARPSLSDVYSGRVDNTIRSVFKSCMVIPLRYTSTLSNIIYVCRKNDDHKGIYTDDLNQSTLDYFNGITANHL